MTTKEQERKALEQIKKIVAGLGEGSYIGTAFEGCFEIAEQNIENDWGCSMKDRAETAEKISGNLIIKNRELMDTINMIKEEAAKNEAELQEDCKALKERIEQLRKDKFSAQEAAQKEHKEVVIKEKGQSAKRKPFAEIRYIDSDGFRFVNVVEPNGWTTSYKLDDIEDLYIK